MRILCVSRKHPPSVGGMQRMNYELVRRIAMRSDATVIAWGRSQLYLPLFLVLAFVRAMYLLPAGRRPDVIYLGDSLLSPLGLLIKAILRRPVAVTAHGRDVTFRFPFYRAVVFACLRRLDRVIAVSRHTLRLCRERGVPEARCVVIPNGIDCAAHTPSPEEAEMAKRWVRRKLPADAPGRPLILTVGRLVRRKGVAPFIREVLPALVSSHPGLAYVIVGEGKERKNIERQIARSRLRDNVLLTGLLPLPLVRGLMGAADLFVMPNVSVRGDMEGFGLVALEAGCAGLPVVASDLEGIRDAVSHGQNGFLIPPGKWNLFTAEVEGLLEDEEKRKEAGERARAFATERFSWDGSADRYMKEFSSLCREAGTD